MDRGGPNSRAGFVLTGGQSSRMGRDKALLELDGTTMVHKIAEAVRGAAGNVTLVGFREGYRSLGYPVLADIVENVGPMGGILTAVQNSPAEWNLIVACDMPSVTSAFFRELLNAAVRSDAMCLAPKTNRGLHPLCAVYHRRVLPAIQQAINHKFLKMQDFLGAVGVRSWPVSDESLLENVNTPAQWVAR